MTDQAPTVYGGRYELHRRIARGGMAEVFLARDQLLDRPVAVKVLFAEFATDPTFVERFRREAKAAANLNHPNIVGIFDWGEENGTYYIVMEYVEGRSLAQTIGERGKLDSKRAADIASEVAAALGHAHERGVAHRDVKPGNVLISNKGEVKVADFGIATAMTSGAESNLTQTGSVMGTATYFSPEQAQGKGVDPRSDLYSLGVVMYEMLVGKPPFTGESPVAIAYKHVQELPLSPMEQGVEVPVSLAAITMKLLAKNPENRYPTAIDLRADIGRYRSGAQLASDAPPVAGPTSVQPVLGDAGRPEHAASPPAAMPPTVVQPGVPQGMPTGMAPTQVNPGYAPTQMQPGAAAAGTQMMPQRGYRESPPRNRPGFGALAFVLILAGLAALAVILLVYVNGRVGDDPSDSDNPVANVTVRSVKGLDRGEATREIETLGLVPMFDEQFNEDVPAGEVYDQDPPPATLLSRGDEVTLFVSLGRAPLTVPSVVGIQTGDAQRDIRDAGFEVEVNEVESDDALEGNVISQSPEGDELRPPGSTIVITVSVGPLSKPVPVVVGLERDEGATLIREAGFEVQFSPRADADIPEGVIIETIPAGEESLTPGEKVDLIVSLGPPLLEVPAVVALTEAEAAAELRNSGFAVEFGQQSTFDADKAGIVLTQDPVGGTEIAAGEPVLIFIGVFTAPTATPAPLPTVTPVPLPTVTPVPLPTSTPVPVPPTATTAPAPPTATLPPPTATPAPPTNTPAVVTPTPDPNAGNP